MHLSDSYLLDKIRTLQLLILKEQTTKCNNGHDNTKNHNTLDLLPCLMKCSTVAEKKGT